MARRLLAILAVGVGAALPATAQAGTYDVLTCSIDGQFLPNNAWVPSNNPGNDGRYVDDFRCLQPAPAGSMGASLAPNNGFSPGTYAGLWFFSPPGTTISNYKVVIRHHWFAPPLPNNPTERTYTAFSYGGPPVSGAGLWLRSDQDRLAAEGHWFGYRGNHSSGAAETPIMTLTRAESKVAMASPEPTWVVVSAGCFTDDGSACTLAPDAAVFTQLFGSRITIHDDIPPTLDSVVGGAGLLAPGVRTGGEPITFSATDNVGIRRADILDVTNAASPKVVASEDFAGGARTAKNEACDFTRPRPCPDLKTQTIAASPPIAGHRTVVLRVTDAAGNQSFSAPSAIFARGPLNGANGGDGSTMFAGFPGSVFRGHGRKRRRVRILRVRHTVRFGRRAAVRGRVLGPVGLPVVGGEVRVLVREARVGAHYVDRGGTRTGPDGRFTVGIPRGDSRNIRLAYKAFLGDDALTAKADVQLRVKAKITAHGSHHVRSHGFARFHGRLVGRPLPPGGVTLELQAFQPGRGWRVVGTTRTRRRGRYLVRYHFNSGFGRFSFRLRLRPTGGYPYALGHSRKMRVRVG